jgi:N,N'-diacetyl-8-epilegionaminate cytidylyltransferase
LINSKKVLALICARGGSKGVPRKNIRPLGGIPLIAWSIKAARACELIDRIVVSTEDVEIAEVGRRFGAEIPFMRPAELAQDDSPEWLVWGQALETLYALNGYRPDYLVNLSPTSPFRSVADIRRSLEMIQTGQAEIIISVKEAARSPYFNMVELDDRCFAHLSKVTMPRITRRQAAPPVYDMTTVVYACRAEFVLQASHIFDGRIQALLVPEIRALDIDTELDFKFAEFLVAGGLAPLL